MTPEIKQRIEQIRRGEVPEGYKRTKAGIVPKEWEEKRIGDVLTQRKTLMCISEDAPLLSFTIEEGVIDPADKKSNKRDFLIKDMATKKFALTEVGDIIYNPANLKFGAIHRNNLSRGVVSPIYGIFYGEQDSIFMGYLLHNQRFIDYAKVYTEGTVEKLKTLKADTFLKLRITLPPLDEQKKIAEILSAQDKLIELQEKKISQLQILKNVCLKNMFPKRGKRAPLWIFPQFSNDWKMQKLNDVVEVYDGTHQTPIYEEKGIMFLSVENINTLKSNKYISEESFEKNFKIYPQKGDILMTRIGDIGTPNVVETTDKLAFYVSLALLKPTHIDTYFLCNLLQSPFVKKGLKDRTLSTASPQKINKDEIGKVDVLIPNSIYEQEYIGNYFRNIDRIINLNKDKLNTIKKQKEALMQLLLTGIVRVK